jgi:secondary thiamine-phosphate synthase enzyme
MTVRTQSITIDTRGSSQIHNLTSRASQAIADSGCTSGIVTVFVAHTTAAVCISEFEPGLIDDLPETFDRLVPADASYRHNQVNHDDNAHSHIRSTILGESVTVPFDNGRLLLGTWQQIVLIDFDTHPRSRTVVIQVMGE